MFKAKKKVFLLLLTLITMVVMQSTAFAAKNGEVTKEGLTVTVSSDSEEYKEGEAVKLTVSFKNTNNYDVSVSSCSLNIPSSISYDKASLKKEIDKINVVKAGKTESFTFTTEGKEHSDLNMTVIIIAAAVILLVVIVLIILLVAGKKKKKKAIDTTTATILIGALLASGMVPMFKEATTPIVAEAAANASFSNANIVNAGVHDPSIVKDEETGTYYIFGSHMAWAKSTDLMKWQSFTNNINREYEDLFGDVWANYCYTAENPQLKGNLWAPDVIWNEDMGKWCMYMSVNGNDWHSAIVLLTADKLDGDWTYVDEVVFSGFDGSAGGVTTQTVAIAKYKINYAGSDVTISARVNFAEGSGEVTRADYSDIREVLGLGEDEAIPGRYNSTDTSKMNCIDPNVEYDAEGNLWLTYGSWSAGIYQIKLDTATGLRDTEYTGYSEYKVNEQDPYCGYKIAGGYYNSGEGPYILHAGDYYYLFVSLGNLETEGGYNMRIFRSESINGPFVDQNGTSAIYTAWDSSVGYNGNSVTTKYNGFRGMRAMSSVKMYGKSETKIEAAQGHNSAFVDSDGKIYLIYHTRYSSTGENFNDKVHQMYINEDGWLVVSPYEYSGETYDETAYAASEIAGTYSFSAQYRQKVYCGSSTDATKGIFDATTVTLSEDGKISGGASGTWSLTNGNQVVMKMTISDTNATTSEVEYKGVFVKQANELATRDETLTFSVCGANLMVWGAKTN